MPYLETVEETKEVSKVPDLAANSRVAGMGGEQLPKGLFAYGKGSAGELVSYSIFAGPILLQPLFDRLNSIKSLLTMIYNTGITNINLLQPTFQKIFCWRIFVYML